MGRPSQDHQGTTSHEGTAHDAASWFALLLDDNAAEEDHQRFRQWLLADPSHAEAYARMEKLWQRAAFEQHPADKPPTRRTLLKTVSGTLAVAAIAGSGLIWSRRPDMSTGIGETRLVRLDDGSTVELSAASSISLRFSRFERRIVLQAGEAYFTVATDPSRPFIVEAGALRATALGTAYSVAITSERTSVSVTQHQVRVEVDGRMMDIGEDQTLDWSNDGQTSISTGETETRLAWRSRNLVFLARPLSEIVEEINRWRNGHLLILDPVLARRQVTAIIDVNDLADIDKTLQQGLPIALSSYTPYLTLVSAIKS